jgi:uncharacterized protein (TIGR03663 family)
MQQSMTTTQLEKLPPAEGEEIVRPPSALPAYSVNTLLSWLTVERAVYIGLALLALTLRLAHLGLHPLSDSEAAQALVAWRAYQGQPVGGAGYSPLIVTLNLIGFLLLGGSEFVARLGPALLGLILVLLPYGLRRYLGRTGALAASALFAISPTALYFSRTVHGDIGAAVGGLVLVMGLFNWLDRERDSQSSGVTWLYLAAAGLVLMLTAAPSSYSTLALLLGFLALAAAVGDKGYATSAEEGLVTLRTRLVGWGNFGLVLAIGLLAVATSLLLNLGGLAATADLLTSWLLGFAPVLAGQGTYPAAFLLSLYEPLILLAGLFGLSVGLLRRRLFDLFLGWWAFGGIALDLLRSGRTAGEVLVPLVPLTLLAGLALGMLWDSLQKDGSWQREGIIAITGLIISGYAYIELMEYTRSGGLTFLLPVSALGLFVLLVILFRVWYDGSSALRGGALVVVTVLMTFIVATGWRLNYGPTAADTRQPLVHAPAAEGLPDLVATLKQLSSWRAGDPYLLDVIADRRVGPAVEWQLRRFKNVTWVDSLDQWPPAVPAGDPGAATDFEAIVTPADTTVKLDEGYAGQDFAVRSFWSPAGLHGQSLIRWIILRTATTPINYEKVVLWVKQD